MAESVQQRLDRMRQTAKRDVVAWVPDDGPDEVGGQVVSVSTGDFGYGDTPIVLMDTGGAELTKVTGFGILEAPLKKVTPGDILFIKYLGKKPSKVEDHEDYRDFRVIHEPTLAS
jgi:hypothetical protein